MDVKELKIKDFPKICRCCLSQNTKGNVFDIIYDGVSIADRLSRLFHVVVSVKDKYPKNICQKCVFEIVRLYKFKTQFDKSRETLLAIIELNKLSLEDISVASEENLNVSEDNTTNIVSESRHSAKEVLTVSENFLKINKKCQPSGSSEDSGNNKIEKPCLIDFDEETLKEFKIQVVSPALEKEVADAIPENLKHSEVEIQEQRTSLCDICKRFFTAESIETHIQSHFDVNCFTCEYCGKNFTRKFSFMSHVRVHTDEKPYNCKYCDKAFRSKNAYSQHMMKHDYLDTFVCPTCGKCFRCKENYENHILKKHSIIEKYSKFNCNICKKFYISSSALINHMKIHNIHRKFSCSQCKKEFLRKRQLKRHLIEHKNNKQYSCNICAENFFEMQLLQKHLLTHLEQKSFVCDISNQSVSLQEHMNDHSEET